MDMTSLAPPSLQSCRILLVEDDPRLLEMLVESLVGRFDANLTCVASGEDALDIEMVEPHDVVVTELTLPGMDGLTLAKHLMNLSDRPVILLAETPALSHAVEAMRLRVCDLFAKPFAMDELLNSISRGLSEGHQARALRRRYRRLRQLVRQVLRERRELNRRIDLVCRDLVGAHRRLLLRVLDREQAHQA